MMCNLLKLIINRHENIHIDF